MGRPATRQFESTDEAKLKEVLSVLREHFHEWTYDFDSEHDLVGFAYYEGCGSSACCAGILQQAAPLALGKELVTKHDFEWVMTRGKTGWQFAAIHPSSGLFIDLQEIENGCLLPGHSPDQPPGKITHDSFENIVKTIEQNS